MRGGALPLLAWGTLLLVLFIGNWIWDDKPVNTAAAAFAAFVIYAAAVIALLRGGRQAVRKGAPESEPELQVVPQASTGAAIVAFALAAIAFGFTFGHFVVYFGIGLLLFGLGRLAVELRAERETRARVTRQHAHGERDQ